MTYKKRKKLRCKTPGCGHEQNVDINKDIQGKWRCSECGKENYVNKKLSKLGAITAGLVMLAVLSLSVTAYAQYGEIEFSVLIEGDGTNVPNVFIKDEYRLLDQEKTTTEYFIDEDGQYVYRVTMTFDENYVDM